MNSSDHRNLVLNLPKTEKNSRFHDQWHKKRGTTFFKLSAKTYEADGLWYSG